MKALIYSAILSCALATPVSSHEMTGSACHALTDDAKRLDCYDRRTGRASEEAETAEEQANTQSGDHWWFSEEESALDSRKDVWLRVTSSNSEPDNIGGLRNAYLWVRCMENRTNLFITFDRYTSDNQNVKYRLDEGAVKKQWMETMNGGDGIGIWSGGRAIPFIKSMLGKDEMVVSYDTYSALVEFKFDISGLNNRIAPLAEACSWRP